MLNMIKMDLYRMVRTKSMYVVWIVMAAAIFFSTSMSKLDIDTIDVYKRQIETSDDVPVSGTVGIILNGDAD